MYCDSLAGLLLAVKHWPAERLNFIVRGWEGEGEEGGGGRREEISMGKRRTATPVPFLEYMHRWGGEGGEGGRGCLWG